ncbi:MAG: hypothetical protein ACRCUS_05310, partial [Anaerovoracaceae bacterium]
NKDSIVIAVSKETLPYYTTDFNYVYDVAVHELYHFYYDPIENYYKAAINNDLSRNEKFPLEANPRIYRKMVYDNLVLAYEKEGSSKKYLDYAKYWNEKWKKEYPIESKQNVVLDMAEGKARYIENMMCLFATNSSKEQEAKKITKLMSKEKEIMEDTSSESYEIGFLSGLLLDRKYPNWKKEISKNPTPPLELLLIDNIAKEEKTKEYDEISEKAKKGVAKKNKENQKKIKDIEEYEKNTKTPLLCLKESQMEGSFSVNQFLKYKDKEIYTDFSAKFKTKNGIVSLKKVAIFIPEEEENLYFPLTKKYNFDAGNLKVKTKELKIDQEVEKKISKEGRIIFIVK